MSAARAGCPKACSSTSFSLPGVHRPLRLQRQRPRQHRLQRLHLRRHFLHAITMLPRMAQAPSSLVSPTQATIAMIASPALRSHFRSLFTGSSLTLHCSAPMAICSWSATTFLSVTTVPCRILVLQWPFFRIRPTCAPIRYRPTVQLSRVDAAFSVRSPALRLTGSLTLNGARVIMAEAAQPTLKWCSMRAKAASLTSSMR